MIKNNFKPNKLTRKLLAIILSFAFVFAIGLPLGGCNGYDYKTNNLCGYQECICAELIAQELPILQSQLTKLQEQLQTVNVNSHELQANITQLGHDLVYLEHRGLSADSKLVECIVGMLMQLTQIRAELDMQIEFRYRFTSNKGVGFVAGDIIITDTLSVELHLRNIERNELYIYWGEYQYLYHEHLQAKIPTFVTEYKEYVSFMRKNYADIFFKTHYLIMLYLSSGSGGRFSVNTVANCGLINIDYIRGATTSITSHHILIELSRYFRPENFLARLYVFSYTTHAYRTFWREHHPMFN